jgi:hypothetical protein
MLKGAFSKSRRWQDGEMAQHSAPSRRMFMCPYLEWCNALRLLHPTAIAFNGMRHISKQPDLIDLRHA